MGNHAYINTQKVTNLSDNSSHFQHEIHDDADEVVIYIDDGKRGEKIAKADMKGGAAAVIKKVYEEGGHEGKAIDILRFASSNNLGVCVNNEWVDAEDLIEILRKCGEDNHD